MSFLCSHQTSFIQLRLLNEPPILIRDKAYTVQVPKVDQDGNELGGIHNTTIQVPLGTYTGWSVRRAGYGAGDLASLNGMFIPFKTTKAERIVVNDPRLSLEERYGTHDAYVAAVRKATIELVNEGFLSPDDAQTEVNMAPISEVLKK